MKKRKSSKAARYAVIAVLGLLLFMCISTAECPKRVNNSPGGEVMLLLLPLIWWLAERTISDFAAGQKKLLREAKEEMKGNHR